MASPDLGGGRRLRRRPGSFLTVFSLIFTLLSSILPSSIPERVVSGESVYSVWARQTTSSPFTAISTVKAPDHSLLASTNGGFRQVDLKLHRILCSCLAMSVGSRSEDIERLKSNLNPRSNLSLSLMLRFPTLSDLQLHCHHRTYAKKSWGLFQLRKLRYNASKRQVIKASLDIHRRAVQQTVLIEANHRRHCSSHRVRYNFFTPSVLNLLSKLFFVNFGMSLHGINGVPDSMGIVTVSKYSGYRRKALILDQIYYRLCTASIIGLAAQYEHTDIISSEFITGELFVDLPSQTLISQRCISDSPETYRQNPSGKVAACKVSPKLGQLWIHLMGQEPILVLLVGLEPQIVVPCVMLWAVLSFVKKPIVIGLFRLPY